MRSMIGATALAGVPSTTGAQKGEIETVALVDYEFVPGTDEPLTIAPGTTVEFLWITDTHNIVVD